MFVADLLVPPSSPRAPAPVPRPPAPRSAAEPDAPFALVGLLAWLACGSLALALLPTSPARLELGATLPFWLVGAPLLNLAWLLRRQLAGACGQVARRLHAHARIQRSGARRVSARTSPASASSQPRRSSIA